jgi:acetyl esterase/lipase
MRILYFIIPIFLLFACESLETISNLTFKSDILPKEDAEIEYDDRMNLSYGEDILQRFDIHIPKNQNQKVPVIVLLHGGGWREGDKTFIKPFVDYLKKKKVVCAIVNANYRLTSQPKITYKEQLEDIDLLLKKLESEANEFGIKPRYFMVGYSAGGHLALLYSYITNQNKIKATGGIAIPSDLTSLRFNESRIGDDVLKFVGKPIEEAYNEYLMVSPAYQIKRNSPPTIAFYGGKDNIVPINQGLFLEKKLKEKKVKYEFYIYPEQTHEWRVLPETLDKMVDFADKFL